MLSEFAKFCIRAKIIKNRKVVIKNKKTRQQNEKKHINSLGDRDHMCPTP